MVQELKAEKQLSEADFLWQHLRTLLTDDQRAALAVQWSVVNKKHDAFLQKERSEWSPRRLAAHTVAIEISKSVYAQADKIQKWIPDIIWPYATDYETLERMDSLLRRLRRAMEEFYAN